MKPLNSSLGSFAEFYDLGDACHELDKTRRQRDELASALSYCLDALTPGTTLGPCEMNTLEGRVAWMDRIRPFREAARAVLANLKE